MCGRFAVTQQADEIFRELNVEGEDALSAYLPNFNVAPTVSTPVLLERPARRVAVMKWGLVPRWARDQKMAGRMINARSETLSQKPSFRNLLCRRHCAVIAAGYYEWKREGTRKTPYFLRLKSGRIMLLAALWDRWNSGGGDVETFTIVTRPPLPKIAHIHDRMPVILSPDQACRWVHTEDISLPEANAILNTDFHGEISVYPVSSLVNSVRNNSPKCIEPVETFGAGLFEA